VRDAVNDVSTKYKSGSARKELRTLQIRGPRGADRFRELTFWDEETKKKKKKKRIRRFKVLKQITAGDSFGPPK